MELADRVTAVEWQLNELANAVEEIKKEREDDPKLMRVYVEDKLRQHQEIFRSLIVSTSKDSLLESKKAETVKEDESEIGVSGASSPQDITKPILLPFPWSLIARIINDPKQSRIAHGMNAEVYICYWTEAQSRVAVKVFDIDISNQLGSYQNELSVAKQLTHPNIIGTIGTATGPDDNGRKRAIVYRFAELGSLQDNLGDLDWEQVLSIFQDVAHALTALHKLKLVHRDVKPANILLTQDFEAMLADFGSTELDRTGYFSMSPAYVDLELLSGNAEVRPWHDMYSLGLSMLQVLCNCKTTRTMLKSGKDMQLHVWMTQETEEGKSIVSERIRSTGCNESMENMIIAVIKSLFTKPSANRPSAKQFASVICAIEEEFKEQQKETTRLEKDKSKDRREKGHGRSSLLVTKGNSEESGISFI